MTDDLTRPIIGIENRTAQEAFDIMCDRIEQERLARKSPSPQPHTGRAGVTPDLAMIEATARKINPGRSEDHIKSVALDSLSIIRALNAALTVEPAHPDDAAVDRFATAMKAKLAKKRAEGRGGWERKDECTAEFLSELLRGHVEKGDPLDVGNLAMMLHQRGERILTVEPEAGEVMVRPLAWAKRALGWFADTPFGSYWVSSSGGTWWVRFNGNAIGDGIHAQSQSGAEALAQADYTARIRSALAP